MKLVFDFVKRIFSKDIPMPVGRWRIEQCNTRLNQKIDLSNEDHCGPCGQYALEKTNTVSYDDKPSKVMDDAKKTASIENHRRRFPSYMMSRSGIVAK
jgi:hypothetical protein